MSRTKHYYTLFIPIIFLFFMWGCQPAHKSFHIGVSQCSDDEWRTQMNREIETESWFYEGVEVEIKSVKDDTEQQKRDIRYFMEQKVDLLVVAPNEAAPLTALIEEVYDAGIPVIVVDRKILSDKYTAYIGGDNYEVGKEVGNYLAKLLNYSGNIAIVSGLQSSTSAIERQQGFNKAISPYPQLHIVAFEDAGWLEDKGYECMQRILAETTQSIDVVFAHNDRMAAGAYRAAKESGREQDFYFIGIDALPSEGHGIDQVLNGQLDATFMYPTGGDLVIQTAMQILNGKPFARENILGTAVINRSNARVVNLQNTQIANLDQKIEKMNNLALLYLEKNTIQQLILWGSLFFIFVIVILLLFLYRSLKSKSKLNQALEQTNLKLTEQKDLLTNQRDQLIMLSEELKEATQAKLKFFTNISHDFRTPLTLVADPLRKLLESEQLGERERHLLTLAKRNTSILLRLVDHILDFRKYENNQLNFTPQKIQLIPAFEEWNHLFEPLVQTKDIHFTFTSSLNEQSIGEVDIEKLERIYFNLLSNAFKFTPRRGTITVTVDATQLNDQEAFILRVRNSGSVIAQEHLDNLFKRFYQVDHHNSGSSGIGLALVNVFTEVHGGVVQVDSNEQIGVEFTICIPLNQMQAHISVSNEVVSVSSQLFAEIPSAPVQVTIPNSDNSEDKLSILVIDDNKDVRSYIQVLLEDTYTVWQAASGEEGIELAHKYVPDLIISDIMMPGIDGIETCKRLKTEVQTSHIPVILLTACSLDEQRIEGYSCGADSYISKPFNHELLLTRIENLLESRVKLKEIYNQHQEMPIELEKMGDIDQQFIQKFIQQIEVYYKDSSLTIEDLGVHMGLSRVQLYRKVKSLTDYSPNEWLRKSRLKKAYQLLKSRSMSVSEVCYEVGFTSPSYFSKCFKEEFKQSPSDLL